MYARHWTKTVCGVVGSLLLGGCMTTKDELLPTDGPTMREIYHNHEQGGSSAQTRAQVLGGLRERALAAGDVDLRDYTRTAHNEIDRQFARLPNPDLVLFVFPHLTADGHPVPGYSTVFPLYERTVYALPGEIHR